MPEASRDRSLGTLKKMKIDTTPLRGQFIVSLEKKDFTWFFSFSGSDVIATVSPWRLITPSGIIVTSEDHDQQFGLPAPVNTGGRVTKELGCDKISDLSHDPQTGDLFLRFSGDRYLQFLQLSCGYEAWRLYMGDLEYICMGGGGYASFERTHFTANKTLHPTAVNAPV